MPRKNNPAETVERILTASLKLFNEKGFEKTSMQDIIDASDISKGAIFYHFKSKEEIFDTVMEKQYEFTAQKLSEWFGKMEGLNAREKLKCLLEQNLKDEESASANNKMAAIGIKSPHLIMAYIQAIVNKSASIIADIIKEGINDGSINAEFPDECSEIFLLLYNFWCDPHIFECDISAIKKRFIFLQYLMKQLGIDIISDEIVELSVRFIEEQNKEVSKWKEQK